MDMRKILSAIILLALFLTACASNLSSQISTVSAGNSSLNTNYKDAAPVITQLAEGTLDLEDTSLAVDAQQANELLFLWQAASSLYYNSTTADAEKEALLNQIQETMTTQQIDAIREMQITNASVSAGMASLAPVSTNNQASNNNGQAIGNGGMPQGGMPDGGMPPSGMGELGAGQGENLSPDQISAIQAARQSSGQNNSPSNQLIIRMVIRLLESKTAAQA
jgi:hypothetical protein